MQFSRFDIEGPVLVQGSVHKDSRGSFSETWRADLFADHGIDAHWVQDNMSVSLSIGTVRGLHWQIPPHAQAKLVKPVTGRIIDVAVDLRQSSASFGQAVSVELDSATNQQLYVPVGFAHGFCTLEANTIVVYKASNIYAPIAERSLFWADPALTIDWHMATHRAILADKDLNAPKLHELTPGDLF
jgi:dTDP-4-dehydrorhamnose 3,5-epimerase